MPFSHSLVCVFTAVEPPCVELGCLCVFSGLLSLRLFDAFGDGSVCIRGVSAFCSALPVNFQQEAVSRERCSESCVCRRGYTAEIHGMGLGGEASLRTLSIFFHI